MRKVFVLFTISLLLHGKLVAQISEYLYPNLDSPSFSNYGTTGLIQMPSARFYEEGSIGFTWSHLDPYLRGSVIAYPFNWFEASYNILMLIIGCIANIVTLVDLNLIKIKA